MTIKKKGFIHVTKINPLIRYYTPKTNKKKLGLLIGFIVVCLITPFTNWLIPIMYKLIIKYKPLWLYT